MKYEYSRFPSEPIKIFKTKNEYCVEIGTYLPIAKRVEDLKKAGMDLMAYRQAYAEFANGTQNIDLDDYVDEMKNIDEIDFYEKKKRYFDIMKRAEKLQQEQIAMMQKKQQEEAIENEVKKRVQKAKESTEN